MDDESRGKPGKPGKDAEGTQGGAGGTGGVGGAGEESGGTGGMGGTGGAGAGVEKLNGIVDRLSGWVFLLLTIAATSAFLLLFLEGRENREALCNFRSDLSRRADDSQTFLNEIESGVRPAIPGISVADLRRSINGLRATEETLIDLNCHSWLWSGNE